MNTSWINSVYKLCIALSSNKEDNTFTRKELLKSLDLIVKETGSLAITPKASLNAVLQKLRDLGYILFISRGKYQVLLSTDTKISRLACKKCRMVKK